MKKLLKWKIVFTCICLIFLMAVTADARRRTTSTSTPTPAATQTATPTFTAAQTSAPTTPAVQTPTPTRTSAPAPTQGGDNCSAYPEWNRTTVYYTGDRVKYSPNGHYYQAAYWCQGNNPSERNGPVGSGEPWIDLGLCIVGTPTPTNTPGPTGTPGPTPQFQVFFDDFNYSSSSDSNLGILHWTVKSGSGGPGPAGVTWRPENVTFYTDPGNSSNKIMRLLSSTQGTPETTNQSEMYTQRIFFEGTYAARVYFTDSPNSGSPDGDNIVQTFFTITPLAYDLDPSYSELDFEYLPNGGWGAEGPIMYMTTWETYQLEPWVSQNVSTSINAGFAGWHTLVIQVSGGQVKYYIDGALDATHGGIYYPDNIMFISFNNWFIAGGFAAGSTYRDYKEEVDWVFYAKDTVLSPAQVTDNVSNYRSLGTVRLNTVQ
ncbi:MAG: hypothetical protein JW969_04280 [Spirochaetales bacterium]|nr:hypothetical protein [Spirochaetales bacterium]